MPKASKFYIGNIPFTATEADLRGFFSDQMVTRVTICTDRETGRPKGFAFVEIEAPVSRIVAEFNGLELMGRTLKVAEAVDKPRSGPAREDRGAPRPGGPDRTGDREMRPRGGGRGGRRGRGEDFE